MIYRMTGKGATYGAVTGRYRTWRPDQEIEGPKGEFAHLKEGSVETTSAVPKREVAAKVGLTKHAKGGGWWEIRKGGEVVTKVQGEEAADKYLEDNAGS